MSLHAPQLEGAFIPESGVLEGTVYLDACLYEEAKHALEVFDRAYAPMLSPLKAWTGDGAMDAPSYYRRVLADGGGGLPRAVRRWILSDERLSALARTLHEATREQEALPAGGPWREDERSQLLDTLARTEARLVEAAGNRVKDEAIDAAQSLKGFSDEVEVIKFELTKAEKELVEAGADEDAWLAHQRVGRPRMPPSGWEYWAFDDEYWADEIGYYRYTLKDGCVKDAEAPTP
jgi:hypothetical protein